MASSATAPAVDAGRALELVEPRRRRDGSSSGPSTIGTVISAMRGSAAASASRSASASPLAQRVDAHADERPALGRRRARSRTRPRAPPPSHSRRPHPRGRASPRWRRGRAPSRSCGGRCPGAKSTVRSGGRVLVHRRARIRQTFELVRTSAVPGARATGGAWSVALCSLALAAGSYATLGFAPLAPLIREDFSLARWQIGAITAIVFGGAAITLGAVGHADRPLRRAADARGRRRCRRLRLRAGRARPGRGCFFLARRRRRWAWPTA